MLLVDLFSQRRMQIIFLLGSAMMFVFYPLLQSFGQVGIWFQVAEPTWLVFYVLFSLLFGILLMLQAHRLTQKTCREGTATGIVGVLTGLVGSCPSCMLLLGLFLPVNAIVFLSSLSLYLTVGSIGLMILTIYLLGGFETHRPRS